MDALKAFGVADVKSYTDGFRNTHNPLDGSTTLRYG